MAVLRTAIFLRKAGKILLNAKLIVPLRPIKNTSKLW
jgi:hypothetical protein